MAELLLYHHAQGQTPGFLAFADELRAAGHTVHAPDLYDGNTFAELDDGVGYAKQVGLYPGDRHLFADSSLPDYDEAAATLLEQRVLSFLDNVA